MTIGDTTQKQGDGLKCENKQEKLTGDNVKQILDSSSMLQNLQVSSLIEIWSKPPITSISFVAYSCCIVCFENAFSVLVNCIVSMIDFLEVDSSIIHSFPISVLFNINLVLLFIRNKEYIQKYENMEYIRPRPTPRAVLT